MRSAAAAVLCSLVLVLAGSAAGKNAATYPADPEGDAAAGPDLTSVRVSNDDVRIVTFEITVANRPALVEFDRIFIWLDLDSKPGTGSPGKGAEALVDAWGTTSGSSSSPPVTTAGTALRWHPSSPV